MIVVSGRVKVFSLTEHGEEILLAVRGPGRCSASSPRSTGRRAARRSRRWSRWSALVVPIAAFIDFLRTHGDAAIVLLQMVTGRLRDADRKRVEFAAYDIPARVARRLVELAERFGEPDGQGVRIAVALSQDELAGWVGASREAVAKALRVLRDRGYVTTGRRTMTVLDLDGLRGAPGPRACAEAPRVGARGGGMARRGVPVRLAVWLFHLALPLAGLWLLLAVPAADVLVEHHPSHFWLVVLVAAVNVGLALLVDRAARRHDDARLLLVGLGFLAAALFFGLHALATPGVLLDSRNGGFALATPVGLALAALFTAASALDFPPARAQRVLRVGPWLRGGLYTLAAVWGIVSLAGLPPLADPAIAARLSGPLIAVAVVSVLLYLLAAVRFYLLYRRRRSVMLLSIITANVLLAESMVAVVLAASWRLTWWLWHVLMVLAFGYVGYSAYVGYRREGATAGLFDGVGTDETVRAVRAEYGAALETLVAALRRQEAGELSANEMALITAGLESRFGLTEGQTAVLGRAAAALRAEREQIGRLDVLVAIGHESRVRLDEQELLQRAVRRVAAGFGGDGVRVGLLGGGRLRFPDELATDPSWQVRRRPDAARGGGRRGPRRDGPVTLDEAMLACPLTVKDRPAGVLLTRRQAGSPNATGRCSPRWPASCRWAWRTRGSTTSSTGCSAVHVPGRRHGPARRPGAGRARRRGRRGDGALRRPARVHRLLRALHPGADRGDAQPLLRAGHRRDPGRGRHRRAVRRRRADGAVQRPGPPARPPAARGPGRAGHAGRGGATAAATPGWPRFRVGINTGPALVGNIGSTALRNFNAMGDAVNVAARLETEAQPGQVVIGESTRAPAARRGRGGGAGRADGQGPPRLGGGLPAARAAQAA